MDVNDYKGNKVGEITTRFGKNGEVVTSNTLYDTHTGRVVAQHIDVRDQHGRVRSEDFIGGKILP